MSTGAIYDASSMACLESSMSGSIPVSDEQGQVYLVSSSHLNDENEENKSMERTTLSARNITEISSGSKGNCCGCSKGAAKAALFLLGIIGLASGLALALTVNPYCAFICVSFLLAFTPGLFPRNDVQQVVLFPQAGTDTEQGAFLSETELEFEGLTRQWKLEMGSFNTLIELYSKPPQDTNLIQLEKEIRAKHAQLTGLRDILREYGQSYEVPSLIFDTAVQIESPIL